VSRRLVAAPRIAIHGDGAETIAFGYLNAAGILDEVGNPWTLLSPGNITPAQVAGDMNKPAGVIDGALFFLGKEFGTQTAWWEQSNNYPLNARQRTRRVRSSES
jgi:hypothetical protein